MSSYSSTKSKSDAPQAWFSCRFLACSLIFAALTACFAESAVQLLPAENVHHPSGWKFATFDSSANRSNILFLGSSLSLICAARTDSVLNTGRSRIDEETCFENLNYDKAMYLQGELQKHSFKNANILNMSMIASMSSDYLKVFNDLIDTGYNPDVMFCAVAPRDFVCLRHGANFPTVTYIQKELTCISQTYPEIAIGRKLKCQRFFNCIADLHFRAVTGWRAMRACATTKFLALFAKAIKRSTFVAYFDKSTLDVWSRQPFTYQYGAVYGPRPNIFADTEQYKTYYQPPNWSGYALQKDAFENLLKLAKLKKIQVIVVSMPLTAKNLKLIDPALLQAYRRDVNRATNTENVSLIDLQDSKNFVDSDFEDSVHLNEFGGRKLYDILARAL